MNHHDIDLEEVDFADELIRKIEKDYGRSIARIAHFERATARSFNIKIIFTDFKLLDAEIIVEPYLPFMPQIKISGIYY